MPALTASTARAPTEDEQEDVILASRYGDLDDIRQFVDTFGVSALAAARDENGNSVLHMCCANGHEDILAYILGRSDIPTHLLRAANASGSTPLHWACLNSHLGCAQRLVAFRPKPVSKPSAVAENAATPERPQEIGSEKLGPALISIRNNAGRTPLGEAEHSGWDDGARWLVSVMDFDADEEGGESSVNEGPSDGVEDIEDVDVTETASSDMEKMHLGKQTSAAS